MSVDYSTSTFRHFAIFSICMQGVFTAYVKNVLSTQHEMSASDDFRLYVLQDIGHEEDVDTEANDQAGDIRCCKFVVLLLAC
jgi:hypothetical protein